MKTRLALVALLALTASACIERAEAVTPADPVMARPGLVAGAPTFPVTPQVCGEDGGLFCTFTFDAGECVRISTSVDLGYQLGNGDRLVDGGSIITPAGTLVPLYPDAGGGTGTYTDGGAFVMPKLNDLYANQIEQACLLPSQAQLSVLLSATGKAKAAPRSR